MSFTSPGDLPNPWIEPVSPATPALASRFSTTVPSGKPKFGLWPNYLPDGVCVYVCVCALSQVQLFKTPRTIAHKAPLTQDFPGKNTGVCCHFFLQGIFLTQGWNPCLLHWQADSLQLSHQGSPTLPSSETPS